MNKLVKIALTGLTAVSLTVSAAAQAATRSASAVPTARSIVSKAKVARTAAAETEASSALNPIGWLLILLAGGAAAYGVAKAVDGDSPGD